MDFFALEPQLIQRLQDQVKVKGRPIDVYPIDEVKVDANDEPQPLRVPCLLLSYDGYAALDSKPSRTQIQDSWTVIVVLANVRGTGRAEARAESQAIVNQVLAALQGWLPPPSSGRHFKELMLVSPALLFGYGKNNSYFPFTFADERTIQKTSTGGIG